MEKTNKQLLEELKKELQRAEKVIVLMRQIVKGAKNYVKEHNSK